MKTIPIKKPSWARKDRGDRWAEEVEEKELGALLVIDRDSSSLTITVWGQVAVDWWGHVRRGDVVFMSGMYPFTSGLPHPLEMLTSS
jgi:hypothetical protein